MVWVPSQSLMLRLDGRKSEGIEKMRRKIKIKLPKTAWTSNLTEKNMKKIRDEFRRRWRPKKESGLRCKQRSKLLRRPSKKLKKGSKLSLKLKKGLA